MASPTVLLEGVFTTLVIDEYEGREVSIYHVPGSYLHEDMPKDKKVLIKLRGTSVYIMCQINQEHMKNVRYDNGQKVLYMLVLFAIYGFI